MIYIESNHPPHILTMHHAPKFYGSYVKCASIMYDDIRLNLHIYMVASCTCTYTQTLYNLLRMPPFHQPLTHMLFYR